MPPEPRDLEERFWEKVLIEGDEECWLWQASLDAYGYGQFGCRKTEKHKYTMVKAHRLSYELLVGPIPDGLEIDHLCRVRSCVNPSHLEPVIHRTNMLRGHGIPGTNARKTHCVHGHEFTPENTSIKSDGARGCRTCSSIRSRERARVAKEERRIRREERAA